MTKLRQRVIGDLRLRNFSESTIASYTRVVGDFARFFHLSPDRLNFEHVRQYLLHVIEQRKISWATYQGYRAPIAVMVFQVPAETPTTNLQAQVRPVFDTRGFGQPCHPLSVIGSGVA